MRITCLMENTACSTELAAEHGLSLHIDLGPRRILFDMGQTEQFACNARLLGVDLDRVDTAVLSHGHYDHGGGMDCFLRTNDHAMVYHAAAAFGGHYHGPEKYIGLDPALKGNPRLIPVEDAADLGDGITLHTCADRMLAHPIDNAGLTVCRAGQFLPETFAHEQYMLICREGRRVLISGCSHRGIANIVSWFRPDVVVGGFHLMKMDPQNPAHAAKLEALACELLDSGASFHTCHCTGEPAFDFLKARMGRRLSYLRAGESITLQKYII